MRSVVVKWPVMNLGVRGCFLAASVVLTVADARADGCPSERRDRTDRPTDQFEHHSTRRQPAKRERRQRQRRDDGQPSTVPTADGGSESRPASKSWSICRPISPLCTAPPVRGFTDVAPAMKWQISPTPEKFDLSMVVGVALPTGSVVSPATACNPICKCRGHTNCTTAGACVVCSPNSSVPTISPPGASPRRLPPWRRRNRALQPVHRICRRLPARRQPEPTLEFGRGISRDRRSRSTFHRRRPEPYAPSYVVGLGYSFRVDGLFHQ